MSDKKFNIFEHHHDHGGGCDCDDHLDEQMDPAQQSMADALRISFGFLKIVMIVVGISYFFSGMYSVQDKEAAIVLQFGKRVGDPVTAQTSKGLNFAWPFPFEKVIKVPNSLQQIQIDSAFWYDMTAHQKSGKPMKHNEIMRHGDGTLTPVFPRGAKDKEGNKIEGKQKDGYVITEDMNLMHLKCAVSYKIGGTGEKVDSQMMGLYIKNIKDLKSAEQVVAAAVEQAIVYCTSWADAVELKANPGAIAKEILNEAQHTLDRIESGIGLSTVTLDEVEYPVAVNLDMQKVSGANAVSELLVERAKSYKSTRLIGAAGSGYEALLELLDRYDIAASSGDQKLLKELDAKLDLAFKTRKITDEAGNVHLIQGEVYNMMNDAESYRSTIVQQTRAKVEKFKSLVEQYEASPELFASKVRQSMLQKILGNDKIEKTFLPDAQLYLEMNRDPAFRKKMARDKAEAQAAELEAEAEAAGVDVSGGQP